MRLFRLIHIVTVYFWDYSGPLLLPLAIMVAIVLLFKWYDKKFLSSKNEKLASSSADVSEEMVKFINVQKFVDERNDAKNPVGDNSETSSFTISPTVGALDRNASYDLSQEALRKEAIVALNSSTENGAEVGVSSFESASCTGDRKTYIPSGVADSKTEETTHVNKIHLQKERITRDISLHEEQSLENGIRSSLDEIHKLNSNCNIDSELGLEGELTNGFELCTETSGSLPLKDHPGEYLPPIIITGKSTDLDSLDEVGPNAISISSSSAINAKLDISDISNGLSSFTTAVVTHNSKDVPNGGELLKPDCSGDESKMTECAEKSSSVSIVGNGALDVDILGGCEDKNNNKDEDLYEEKGSEGRGGMGDEAKEESDEGGEGAGDESEDADDQEEETDSSEVDDSDDEVISYDLESLHHDDDDVTSSYTVKLSSQITDDSTPETSVESTPKHSTHSLVFPIVSPQSKNSPLKSCLKEASESFLGEEETAVLTPPRVKFGEIKVTEVDGLGSCAGESSAPQIWNCGDDSSSDDNLY